MTSSSHRDSLLQHRYGADHQPSIIWNETVETIVSHRSQRAYCPTR